MGKLGTNPLHSNAIAPVSVNNEDGTMDLELCVLGVPIIYDSKALQR